MKKHIRSGLLALLCPAVFAIPAHAALVISSGNVVSNSYSYSLTYADMASSTKFAADVFSVPNFSTTGLATMAVVQSGTGTGERHFITHNPAISDTNFKTASFTYKFDFSGAGYTVNSMTIYDAIYYLSSSGVGTTASIMTEYSTDNVNWTSIRTVGTVGASSSGTKNFSFAADTSAVYYRVSVAASATGNLGFNSQALEWGRSSTTTTPNPFSVSFALSPVAAVPEPASSAILGAAAVLVTAAMSRRRGKR